MKHNNFNLNWFCFLPYEPFYLSDNDLISWLIANLSRLLNSDGYFDIMYHGYFCEIVRDEKDFHYYLRAIGDCESISLLLK